MIGVPAKAPYVGFTLYKVFHKTEGRFFAVLVRKPFRTTIAYGKYVLETTLGRKLRPGHHAHHKDEVKTNDVVSNLEEKAIPEHLSEHNQSPIRHGSAAGYRRGCRCAPCKKGKAFSQKKWQTKRTKSLCSSAVAAPAS